MQVFLKKDIYESSMQLIDDVCERLCCFFAFQKSVFGLEDLGQNVSARLTTLEGSCVKSALHSALNMTVGKLSLQVR
jgi:hypothetical protein